LGRRGQPAGASALLLRIRRRPRKPIRRWSPCRMMTCCSATACGCLRWRTRSGCVQPVGRWACTTRPITAGSVGAIAGARGAAGPRAPAAADAEPDRPPHRAGRRRRCSAAPGRAEHLRQPGTHYQPKVETPLNPPPGRGTPADPREPARGRPGGARPRWARTFLPGPRRPARRPASGTPLVRTRPTTHDTRAPAARRFHPDQVGTCVRIGHAMGG
jgi:hypothetical protein